MAISEPIYRPTAASAIAFAAAGRLEEWVHLFLCAEGRNRAFSDGLKLEPRRYRAPKMMNLSEFERCCGPEPSMRFRVPEAAFDLHVGGIAEKYGGGDWDMPPLIVHRDTSGYVLSDGNHRYEALKRLGLQEYWAIVWETAG